MSLKVSIITIVFNGSDCIADCLQSVRNQTYPNIEHIVIDGDSTDGTQQVIEPYSDGLGYYHSEKDAGLYDALNKGVRQATGNIVGVLHADDVFFDRDTVQRVVDEFHTSSADLIHANGMFVNKNNPDKIRRFYKSKPFKKRYLKWGWIPLHTTIYVRRDVYDSYGLYNDRYAIAGDYEISLRWFRNDDINKHFMDAWVVKMRLGGKSTSAKWQRKKSMEDLEIIKKYNLWGWVTLAFKVGRKIPQYLWPRIRFMN